MTLLELDGKILELEEQVKQLNDRMKEICDNRDRKMSVMPKQYYVLLKERQSIEAELRPLWIEQSKLRREAQEHSSHIQRKKHFVNFYGEATEQYVTCATYERTQKRMEQAILRNMGM